MENSLRHYGVLGMKWGVRRTRRQLGRTNSGKRTIASETHDDYENAHNSKDIRSMSDKELRSRINRLQMEQQYTKLNPSTIDSGRQYLSRVIKAGATVATVTSNALTIYNNYEKIRKIVDPSHS